MQRRTGRPATNEELAYCAGIIDADGCLTVHIARYKIKTGVWRDTWQPVYQPRIWLKQLDHQAIELCGEIFPGTIGIGYNNNTGSRRPMNLWKVDRDNRRDSQPQQWEAWTSVPDATPIRRRG